MKSSSGPIELFSVLLVDDQPIVAEAVKRLVGEQTRLKYCSDPNQAVAVALETGPTVILLDWVMPDVDGLTLLAALRAHPKLAKIPVILLSSREDPEQKALAFEKGASDYLVKLPHKVELLARLRHHSQAYVRMLQRDQALQALRASQAQLEESNQRLQTLNQELSEANRARGQFLARMSHEIRTPINGILGVTQLLKKTELQPRQADYARIISSSGELLLSLIEDILDFSKMEADKLVLEEVEFDLNELVEEVMQLLAVSAHKKGLEFVARIDPQVPDRVQGDPTRLRQVLLNLLGNAIKFTAQGQVRLEIDLLEQIANGLHLRLGVHDTGIGVSPEQQLRLFQAFTQADSSTTRKFGGTGLGLAIARHLCERMDGRLELDSRAGEGSTFRAEVWLRRGAPVAVEALPLRVLIVDQSPSWRRGLESLLEGRVQKISAISPAEAGTVQSQDWEVVLAEAGLLNRLPFTHPRILPMHLLGKEADGGVFKPMRRSQLLAALRGEADATVSLQAPAPVLRSEGRILLVEDNLINQTIALEMLQELGHPVDLAENGREAVEMSERTPYRVIVMDCEMPEMDGYQATAAIRRREQNGPRTPIIAMTAYAMSGDRERCLEAGMDDYLTKPFDLSKVSQVLQRWLATCAV
ncbi:MAG: response regulator [Candidatus Eremiobacteraeota bacterium]|nr:response regulator [Candidatus Eremiobacteraeota bacterium]